MAIDEVGYGSWAGPLVICTVVYEFSLNIRNCFDSKKMSRIQRKAYYDSFMDKYKWILCYVNPQIISKYGLRISLNIGIFKLLSYSDDKTKYVLLDGAVMPILTEEVM